MSIHTEHKSTDQPGEPGHNESGHFFTPNSAGGGGGNVPPHAPNDYSEAPRPERPWYKRWPVVAGTGALALAVAAGAGATVSAKMGGDNRSEHQSGPQPTTGQSLEPTPSPTATQTTERPTPMPTPTETIKIPERDDSAKIEYMRGLDIKDFNDLPRAQRLKYVAWAAYRADQGDYHDFYSAPDQAFTPPDPDTGYPGEFLDTKNPYNSVFPEKAASKFDDGQKIMDQALFWDQLFNAQAANKSDLAGKLDQNEALKIMSARSYYVDTKHPEQTAGTYDEQAHFIRQSETTSHLGFSKTVNGKVVMDPSGEWYESIEFTKLQSGTDEEGNPIQYKDVIYKTHGRAYKGRFVFETIPLNITNPQTNRVETININMWLQYSDQAGVVTFK